MVWARRSAGTLSTGTAPLTPAAPAGFQAGDVLLLWTGEYIEANNLLPTPSGWTKLHLDSIAHQIQLYGKIAAGGDTMPTIDWAQTNAVTDAWAQVFAYTGGSLSIHNSADRNTLSVNLFVYSTGGITITQDNCLVVAYGCRNKTATSNGSSISAIGQSLVTQTSTFPNGTDVGIQFSDLIQTTATTITSLSQSISNAESVTQNVQGGLIALLPGTPVNSASANWVLA